jgi:hypothetical protein
MSVLKVSVSLKTSICKNACENDTQFRELEYKFFDLAYRVSFIIQHLYVQINLEGTECNHTPVFSGGL